MSQPNLTGIVSKTERRDDATALITVELRDPTIPADRVVEGSLPTLSVVMPLDKVKNFGLGCEVEITLKKKSAPRTKKAEKVETKTDGTGEPTSASDDDVTEEPAEEKPAAAPAPSGRRRAAASSPTA